ncbi:tRNA pseudouridine(38-40) synthase TruA [Nesterenkonia natronophila]|uniref:tRNA pseudouridine synthase A n=1 Tax=Nesterenkonia natronophila TaxID=2174932 RepID=A0A3A4F1T2_9MICC|nr:tRNA pseudouridine(38-40) synthase TruA [Nesterenkonia natronophila]RJN32222.1 tRNA pseudouridine(38-40) synthase TruA [Nesterenkonia natronophila]
MRVRLDLAYDGIAYSGWAHQPEQRTVEGVLRGALATVIRRDVPVVVAGRTDAGVHARGQVVHLDLTQAEWESLARGRDIAPEAALLQRLNGVLGSEGGAVVLHAVNRVSANFDARFSALTRTYTYRIADRVELWDPLRRHDTAWIRPSRKFQPNGQLDAALMDAEATSVLGLHDFGSFCRPREHATSIRRLAEFSVRRGTDGVITALVTADAFCHHMVRALIGACLDVGEGRREPGWLMARLTEPAWDERVRLAPPQGLVLERVDYPDEEEQLAARAEQTRARRERHSRPHL